MDSTSLSMQEQPAPGLFHAGVHPVMPDPVTERLESVLTELGSVDGSGASDASRIDHLRLLEQTKAATAAAQARITVAFEDSQRAVQEAAGVRARDRGRGIGDQVAMARGTASNQGGRHLGFARAIVTEMPHTHALLSSGDISEWVATILVRETAVLNVEDRRLVDERLCAMTLDPATGELHPPFVLGLSPRRVVGAAFALAAELDPEAVVRRAGKAAHQRRVTCRPAPDTMASLNALLPVAQGVACWASLDRSARAAKAAGDPRSLDQLRADLLVERLTGQATADAVPVEVGVVMGEGTVTGESERPGRTADGTVVPADLCRALIRHAHLSGAGVSARRIEVDPATGQVTGVGRKRRFHRGGDRLTIRHRDQTCRLPGCSGPIQHIDHADRHADGGETSRGNGQGLCEAHNYVKEMPGWTTRVVDDRPGRHTIEVTTPTGHTYRSNAPPGLPPAL
jgi:Domain of unknown function (DUF222)